jgi:hypothetical protein
VFVLDFLDNRLGEADASEPNLTVARFEMERRDEVSAGEGNRPTVREVRFEGDHLLDSIAACRMIALEGRALIDLSLRVSFGSAAPEPARFPLRLSLERDHALLLTGFGAMQPEASANLHRNVVRAVERALDQGIADVKRVESLAQRIDEFARANQEATHATMLQASPVAGDAA